MAKLEQLEKLLSEANSPLDDGPQWRCAQTAIGQALRNAAPAMLEVVKAAKKYMYPPLCDYCDRREAVTRKYEVVLDEGQRSRSFNDYGKE